MVERVRPSASLRRRARRLLPLLLWSPLACSEPEDAADPLVRTLDGLYLAPPTGPGAGLLLCGRFEVTVGEFLGAEAPVEERDRPVAFVSRAEASAWAETRGMRLPSLDEWLELAGFATGGGVPGGGALVSPNRANTMELGIHEPLPVGVFERSGHPEGAYDFEGNVWEWVRADRPEEDDGLPPRALACGGSFAASSEREGRDPVRVLEAEERAADLGFRVVTEAVPWLRDRIEPVWARGRAADVRGIRGALQRWRPALREQLATRLRESGADPAFCSLVREP